MLQLASPTFHFLLSSTTFSEGCQFGTSKKLGRYALPPVKLGNLLWGVGDGDGLNEKQQFPAGYEPRSFRTLIYAILLAAALYQIIILLLE